MPTSESDRITLPARQFFGDPAWVFASTDGMGFSDEEVQANSRHLSRVEWSLNMDTADEMRASHRLDQAAFDELMKLFRARHLSIWGEFSPIP